MLGCARWLKQLLLFGLGSQCPLLGGLYRRRPPAGGPPDAVPCASGQPCFVLRGPCTATPSQSDSACPAVSPLHAHPLNLAPCRQIVFVGEGAGFACMLRASRALVPLPAGVGGGGENAWALSRPHRPGGAGVPPELESARMHR